MYQNSDRTEWNLVGQDVVTDLPGHKLVDLALSGDGTTLAVVSEALAKDSTGMQMRRVQVLSVPNYEPVGAVIVDQFAFTAKSQTNICLSTDGSLLTMGMANRDNGAARIQTWYFPGTSWEKLGNAVNTTQSSTAMEFSGDCRTVVLTNADSQTSIYSFTSTDWVSQNTGIPSTRFASVVLDGDGSRIAARSFATDGTIDIYDLVQTEWTKTFSISRDQVYEGE